MKILMVGGTGNISTHVTQEALNLGHSVYHLNRGNNQIFSPLQVTTLKADNSNKQDVEKALGDLFFDVVVDWLVYTPDQARQAVEVYSTRTAHYFFISSCSAYQKPPVTPIHRESTPLGNPFHTYAQEKIACEEVFTAALKKGFPLTIIRPSHTYGDGWLPTPFGSADHTVARRIFEGKPVILPGDGQSLWTLTHATDFARALCLLLANPLAKGETFHITSDEYYTWETIHNILGQIMGKKPHFVYMTSDFIFKNSQIFGPGIRGDKCYSLIFDNTKIKQFVPSWSAQVPLTQGLRQNLERLTPYKEKLLAQEETNSEIDRLISLSSQGQ